MRILKIARSVSISQVQYIHDLLAEYGFSNCKSVSDPFGATFLDNDVASPACDSHIYLSLCMSLMYLALISRPDILFAVTYLVTKCSRPTIWPGFLSSCASYAISPELLNKSFSVRGTTSPFTFMRTQAIWLPYRWTWSLWLSGDRRRGPDFSPEYQTEECCLIFYGGGNHCNERRFHILPLAYGPV